MSGELNPLYESYIEKKGQDFDKLLQSIDKEQIKEAHANITIILFMEEENINPSKAAFNSIVGDIEEMQGLPPGNYSIILNDNDISTAYGKGTKDSQLIKGPPERIIKN